MDGAHLILLKEYEEDNVEAQQQLHPARAATRPMRFKVQRRHTVCASAQQHRQRRVAVCNLAPPPPPPLPHTPTHPCDPTTKATTMSA